MNRYEVLSETNIHGFYGEVLIVKDNKTNKYYLIMVDSECGYNGREISRDIAFQLIEYWKENNTPNIEFNFCVFWETDSNGKLKRVIAE